MGRAALRQVKSGAMRDTLADLQKDGWIIETTNGNHIRLQHPDAAEFVIAPKTTSDHRACLNVRSDCRKALKMSEQARLLASATPQLPTAPLRDLPLLQIPSARKKPRWDADEHRRQQVDVAVQAAVPPQDVLDEALRVLTEGPTLTEAVAAAQALDRPLSGPTPAPSAPQAPSDELVAQVLTVLEPPRPRRARRPRAKAQVTVTRSVTVETSLAGLPQIDAAAFDLAMKVITGQMQRLEITADMVGKTLAYDGQVVLLGAAPVAPLAAAPQAALEAAPARRKRVQPSATRVDRSGERHATVRGLVLQTLGALGEWVSNQDLADLVHADAGYESARSMAGMLAAVLGSLREAGLVETGQRRDGRALRAFHRALAA
jgi:predicted RNA binding protein YcfA (HicA-like mRNA interferase family)